MTFSLTALAHLKGRTNRIEENGHRIARDVNLEVCAGVPLR
ncbi:MAG TPA: hypothetical protein VH414_02935 [Lichenihabitans sp.]|jgi:hypothetical protein|nr:hypothetical protein [Lichenihabitans sp.]